MVTTITNINSTTRWSLTILLVQPFELLQNYLKLILVDPCSRYSDVTTTHQRNERRLAEKLGLFVANGLRFAGCHLDGFVHGILLVIIFDGVGDLFIAESHGSHILLLGLHLALVNFIDLLQQL